MKIIQFLLYRETGNRRIGSAVQPKHSPPPTFIQSYQKRAALSGKRLLHLNYILLYYHQFAT